MNAVVLCTLFIFCGVAAHSFRPWMSLLSLGTREVAQLNTPAVHSVNIDTNLYSRQLLVYGTDAQQALSSAHVLVVGKSSISCEIVKNLALAGVAQYARALNSFVDIVEYESIEEVLKQSKVTSVVVTDQPLEDLKELDKQCRLFNISMVSAIAYHGCGIVFNDFNSNFEVTDVDGEPVKKTLVKSCTSEDNDHLEWSVECIEEESLELKTGDLVEVCWSGLTVTTKVVKVIDEKRCILRVNSIEDGDSLALWANSSLSVKQVKLPVTAHHHPLLSQLSSPSFNSLNACDSPKKDLLSNLCLFTCMNLYEQHKKGTVQQSIKDRETFREAVNLLVRLMWSSKNQSVTLLEKHALVTDRLIDLFHLHVVNPLSVTALPDSPVVSVVGALASQEVIKSITHKYTPINQFQIVESFVHTSGKSSAEMVISNAEVLRELAGLKVFVVGAGALGCELLKNFALMGVGLGVVPSEPKRNMSRGSLWHRHGLHQGGVLVTDMDDIERHNLNRQLLYRGSDIGKHKSKVAAVACKGINPNMKIAALTERVSAESEHTFDHSFWQEADVVITALDNVEARQYVDEQCVRHGRWLIDSGTLGTKGNTQVVVPGMSESYSSSVDPPETAVPQCTIKSFPYKFEHCVAWGKTIFEQLFGEYVTQLQSLLSLRLTATQLTEWLQITFPEPTERLRFVRLAFSVLSNEGNSSARETGFISWAVDLFRELYQQDVQRLIKEHPEGAIDDDGALFWSGSKKMPLEQVFDASNTLHREFVVSTVQLLSTLCGLSVSEEKVDEYLKKGNAHSAVSGSEKKLMKSLLKALSQNQSRKSLLQLKPVVFDKDNESLGHVRWISTASNLRARSYSIEEGTALETQRIAGNIIPAVATTTALVTGLVSTELVKIAVERIRRRKWEAQVSINERTVSADAEAVVPEVKGTSKQRRSLWQRVFGNKKQNRKYEDIVRKMEDHRIEKALHKKPDPAALQLFRNSFVNLATGALTFSEPVGAEPHLSGVGGEAFTLWDVIKVDGCIGNLTVDSLKQQLEARHRVTVNSLLLGDSLVYSESMSSDAEVHLSLLETIVVSLVDSVLENRDRSGEYSSVELDSGDRELVKYLTHLKMTSSKAIKKSRSYRTEESSVLRAIEDSFLEIQSAVLEYFEGKLFVDLEVLSTRSVDGEEKSEDVDVTLPRVRVMIGNDVFEDLTACSRLYANQKRNIISKMFRAVKKWFV